METLSHTDILALNHAIGEIYAARDLESFYSVVFSSIREIISHELCSFNDIGLAPTRFLKIISRSQTHIDAINKHRPALNAYVHEHPLFSHVTSDHVFKTTDVAPKNKFKATAIYNEFYRHLDTETQIGFSMPVSRETASLLVLSRSDTDFSERDRLLLTLLKPHCINALRNVTEFGQVQLQRDLLLRGAEQQRQGVVLYRKGGLIMGISELAREMCSRYFTVICAEGCVLPEAVEQWLATETRPEFVHQVERNALVIEKDGKRLTIKLTNDITSGDCILLMTESDPAVLLRNLQRYGLTPRETELVRWLSKGKTNAEIATILGMGKRTADKHLENIFSKLGVESRAAAVALIRTECDLN
jgi:DNA-binding CsgD family transcriptional regulator